MFGELIIAYLFLAGLGAGGVAAASLVDLAVVREPFGEAAVADFAEKSPVAHLTAFVFTVSCIATLLGAACLALDLGRLDRVLELFLEPPSTLMNLGAWAVALLAAVSAVLAMVRVLYMPWMGRRAVVVFEVAAIGLALVVATYAGLLLNTLTGVRLWTSLWVPVLFALSAASCGCAALMVASLFMETDEVVACLVDRVARVDMAIIAAEAVVALLFVAFALGSDHPGVQASAESLMEGAAALPWWVGFVACGIVAPLAVEVTCFLRSRLTRVRRSFAEAVPSSGVFPAMRMEVVSAPALPMAALALAAVLVLAGALSLRAAVVEAGEQRELTLQTEAAEPAGAPALTLRTDAVSAAEPAGAPALTLRTDAAPATGAGAGVATDAGAPAGTPEFAPAASPQQPAAFGTSEVPTDREDAAPWLK